MTVETMHIIPSFNRIYDEIEELSYAERYENVFDKDK